MNDIYRTKMSKKKILLMVARFVSCRYDRVEPIVKRGSFDDIYVFLWRDPICSFNFVISRRWKILFSDYSNKKIKSEEFSFVFKIEQILVFHLRSDFIKWLNERKKSELLVNTAHGKMKRRKIVEDFDRWSFRLVTVLRYVKWSRKWKSLSTLNTLLHFAEKIRWSACALESGNAVQPKRSSLVVPTSIQHPQLQLFDRRFDV